MSALDTGLIVIPDWPTRVPDWPVWTRRSLPAIEEGLGDQVGWELLFGDEQAVLTLRSTWRVYGRRMRVPRAATRGQRQLFGEAR